ncbi:hypothetical protein Tco_1318372, partial [Tanacetum coccineum]
EKTDQAPKASPEIALSEDDQMKLITKRRKTQFHSSHASGSGVNEETSVSPGVPDVLTYGSEDEQISWKSSDEDDDDEVSISKDDDDNADNEEDDDQDDDNEQTELDNDDDDFVHPKLSTFDEEERHEEKLDEEEEGSDQRINTPSHFESTDDEVTQGDHVEEEKLDEEKTTEEEEVNKMYNDVNVNLERRDTKMTDDLLANSSSVSSGFISKMLNPNPDTGIDSILNLNIESTSLVDVPVTNNDEIPPSFVTTLPPLPIPLIQPLQQTPVSTPKISPSTSLQNLPTFGSLFKFEDRVKSLEDDFSEFKQTNLFAEAVSPIPGIVDKYLANQMNEAVKATVQLQIEKSVNEQLKAEVLIRSSNKAKISHAIAANLSELELKKILIDKMENNKSVDRSVQQKTLYKTLVDAYETDKTSLQHMAILSVLKDDKTSKSTGSSKEGSKSKTRSTSKSAQAEEQVHTVKDLEEPAHQEFETGFTKDHPVDETSQLPDWFQKPAKPPTLDLDWNMTFPANHGPIQPWISTLAQNEDPRKSFNELMDTPLYFSTFMLNRLKVDTLTPELLAGPTFELMKGSCKILVELEYFLKDVYKATTDQLD